MNHILKGCCLQARLECVSVDEQMIPCLCETLYVGTKVCCDRFFTSIPALDHLLKKPVYITGTVMKNWVPKAIEKLPSDQTLKRQGRGASATVTRADGKLFVVKWYDNKPVEMLSVIRSCSYTAIQYCYFVPADFTMKLKVQLF